MLQRLQSNPNLGRSRRQAGCPVLHANQVRRLQQLSAGQGMNIPLPHGKMRTDLWGCSELRLLSEHRMGPSGSGMGSWIWHNCRIWTPPPSPGLPACGTTRFCLLPVSLPLSLPEKTSHAGQTRLVWGTLLPCGFPWCLWPSASACVSPSQIWHVCHCIGLTQAKCVSPTVHLDCYSVDCPTWFFPGLWPKFILKILKNDGSMSYLLAEMVLEMAPLVYHWFYF